MSSRTAIAVFVCCVIAAVGSIAELISSATGTAWLRDHRAADSRAAGVQLVCYGQNGQPLFPVQVLKDVDVKGGDEPTEGTYDNGLHVWVRASSCVAAQMTAEDLAEMKAKAARPAPASTPTPPAAPIPDAPIRPASPPPPSKVGP